MAAANMPRSRIAFISPPGSTARTCPACDGDLIASIRNTLENTVGRNPNPQATTVDTPVVATRFIGYRSNRGAPPALSVGALSSGFKVQHGFCNLRELGVRGFLFLQCLFEWRDGVLQAEAPGKCRERTVHGDFVVFDGVTIHD